jgi:hypothetical protein
MRAPSSRATLAAVEAAVAMAAAVEDVRGARVVTAAAAGFHSFISRRMPLRQECHAPREWQEND